MRGGDTASGPDRDELTAWVFRALYPEFDLRTVGGTTHVVVPGNSVVRGAEPGRCCPSDRRPRAAASREDAVTAQGQVAGAPRCGMFEADEDHALAELERAWAEGGYQGFGVDDGIRLAVNSAGDVFMGDTPGALAKRIRAHCQARQ